MQYKLRDGLSFCFVDGHPIFLDVSGDRYFMLPTLMERAFAAYIDGRESSAATLRTLLEREILAPAEHFGRSRQTPPLEVVTLSATEERTQDKHVPARAYVEVLATVLKIRRSLRKGGLYELLNDLAIRRKRKASPAGASSHESIETSILAATNQFCNARKWVPVGNTCLLDSLSLATYLANRHLPADLVFGVTLSPFAAHCWVQFRHIVLNETVTGATAHTPILVW